MRGTHKKLGQLIKAYAECMDDEETFSFEAFGKPREAMVTFAEDGLIETVQTWDGEMQLFTASGAKNFTPEYAALSLIKMIVDNEEEHSDHAEISEDFYSFLDTEEGMRIWSKEE